MPQTCNKVTLTLFSATLKGPSKHVTIEQMACTYCKTNDALYNNKCASMTETVTVHAARHCDTIEHPCMLAQSASPII